MRPTHTVNQNTMRLTCDVCHTTRNEPFCPICEQPYIGDDFIRLKYDGLAGLEKLESEQAGNVSQPTDLFDLFDNPSL